MTYDDFVADLNTHYYDLWNIGLKKKANHSLKQYLQEFNKNVDEKTRFAIWYQFCENYCQDILTSELYWYYKHPALSYELSKNVIDYLNQCSNQMPQLKWLYLLTRDKDVLEKAFHHEQRDQQIIECKFQSYIDTLEWGLHHASEGVIIITDELALETINACNSMIEQYNIPTEFQHVFHSYVRLYQWIKKFSESDYKDFMEFCKDYDVTFQKNEVFYYT